MHQATGIAWNMTFFGIFFLEKIFWQEIPTTQLRSHVVEAHKMAAYKYQCDYCPKRFDTKAHIREHVRHGKRDVE
jgi:hypothetical protein